MKGLVIRYSSEGFFLCDGQPPIGCTDDDELFIGNVVDCYETWDEANDMRMMIESAYGLHHTKEEKPCL